jgi:hypothetical protein
MPFLDISPQMQERVVCSISAAVKYDVPANIVLAVAEKEAGKPGQWVKNSNGTHDVGPMQFNTSYLKELTRYGINANNVAAAGCYPFDLAAWRLRLHIRKDSGDLWTRAANYHSRTPQYNTIYRADLMRKAIKWADWLDARFVTDDVQKWNAIDSITHTISRAARAATARPTLSTPVPQGLYTNGQEGKYVPRELVISDR